MKIKALMSLIVAAAVLVSTVQSWAFVFSDTILGGNLQLGSNINTTDAAGDNVFVGDWAGYHNTSGNGNTLLGRDAGYTNSTGNYNTFLGFSAGYFNTGDSNTFLGYNAGYLNSSGVENTFLGRVAGYTNSTGYFNTFLGYSAGYLNSSGWDNISIGHNAGYSNNGNGNTFVGTQAGYANTGILNVFLGSNAGYGASGSNKLYIDNCYTGYPCTTPLIYGEFDNRIVAIDGMLIMGSPPVTISDRRLKQDVEPLTSSLEKIMRLRGVSFNYIAEKKNYAKGFGGEKQLGLIAQEVEAVFPELVYTNSKGIKAIAYDKLGPVLVEAVKQQQNEIVQKDARIAKLEKAVEEQKMSLAAQQEAMTAIIARLTAIEHSAKAIVLK